MMTFKVWETERMNTRCGWTSARWFRKSFDLMSPPHAMIQVAVICKNKKDGKQLAAAKLLQQLHPHINNWGSLLRMYGNRLVAACIKTCSDYVLSGRSEHWRRRKRRRPRSQVSLNKDGGVSVLWGTINQFIRLCLENIGVYEHWTSPSHS